MSSAWSTLLNSSRAEQMALYGGSPAALLQLQGSIKRVEVIETFGTGHSVEEQVQAVQLGDALIDEGITIWIEGYFPSTNLGEPVAQERADTLDDWGELYDLLMTSSYELFLHYDAGASPLYRKYRAMTTAYLRSSWADPLNIAFRLAAITSNRTLYDQAPGLP